MRKLPHRGFASIGLYNPKTNENVGAVLRAAMCYEAALVVIQGQRYTHSRTDTMSGYKHIPLQTTEDLMESIPFSATPVAIEFIESATPLPHFTHPDSAFYIFGPEDGSIPKHMLDRCKHKVFVPTAFCMNLAACVNVLLYDRLMKRGELRTK